MRKFIYILMVIFAIVFIGQKSHVIQKRMVKVPNLGTSKEEYYINWDNFFAYLGEASENIEAFSSNIKKRFSPKRKR